jgi:hypothetical protein
MAMKYWMFVAVGYALLLAALGALDVGIAAMMLRS